MSGSVLYEEAMTKKTAAHEFAQFISCTESLFVRRLGCADQRGESHVCILKGECSSSTQLREGLE